MQLKRYKAIDLLLMSEAKQDDIDIDQQIERNAAMTGKNKAFQQATKKK